MSDAITSPDFDLAELTRQVFIHMGTGIDGNMDVVKQLETIGSCNAAFVVMRLQDASARQLQCAATLVQIKPHSSINMVDLPEWPLLRCFFPSLHQLDLYGVSIWFGIDQVDYAKVRMIWA